MKEIILKRIDKMSKEILLKDIDNLRKYNIQFYDNKGCFNYSKFQNDCIKTAKILYNNDTPHPKTNIKYQLCNLLATIQSIVGIRNFYKFIERKDVYYEH